MRRWRGSRRSTKGPSQLDSGLANAKAQSKKSMRDRFAKKRADRKKGLISQGKSESEAEKQANQESADAMAVEEQKLDADYAEANEIITGTTAPSLSEGEIEKKVSGDMVAEEDKMRKAAEIQANIDKEKALAELNRKQAELEKLTMDRQQEEAERASASAAKLKLMLQHSWLLA